MTRLTANPDGTFRMSRNLFAFALMAVLAALLAGCGTQDAAPPADTGASLPPVAVDQPVEDVPPATAPVTGPAAAPDDAQGTASQGDAELARFDGYGDLRFGIAADDMPKAWGGELTTLGKDDNPGCYFMTPTWVKVPAEFAFMIGDGKFARYGTESAKFVAPGGGKVGMTKAEIEALYPGRIEERPHKYTDGQYLRIADRGNGVLVFETEGKVDSARVTEWRVGVPPQVDFVEGCS